MDKITTKKHLTKPQYYQLEGLIAVAHTHCEALKVIEEAMINLTGEKTEVYGGGHCGDFTYGQEGNAKCLMKKLGLKIK